MRKPASYLALILYPILFLMNAALADDDYPKSESTGPQSPYFEIQSADAEHDAFPLKKTDVEASLAGVVAEVKVTQEYGNAGTKPINARYVFPASTRAAIHAMSMQVGQEVIAAKIKEKEKAHAEFEDAKQAGKSASLLEQKRPNVFTMDVANVMPGEEVKIELRYTEPLIPEDGQYEFVFPTVVGPRYTGVTGSADATSEWVRNPYMPKIPGLGTEAESVPAELPKFHLHVSLAAPVPIQEIACTTHKTTVQYRGQTQADVDLDAEEKNPADRDFILKYGLRGKKIESGLLLSQGADENHFLVMVQPPERAHAGKVLPREYIFVLDVSGSMNGFPLETARDLMENLIGTLTPRDKFNVVLFAGNSAQFSPTSVSATPTQMIAALNWIGRAQGSGGTELRHGLERALAIPRQENYSRNIAVITDGYIDAEHGVFKLIEDARGEANVFAFGIGIAVNRYLIEGIAKAGMGEPFIVTKPDEAQAQAEKFQDYIRHPLMTDIRVKYIGFETSDVEPATLPDLMADRPILLQGKWKGPMQGRIVVTGMTATGPFEKSILVGPYALDERDEALRYLWARDRIAALSDYHNGSIDAERRSEITALGLNYNLMTEFTSFIAVSETIKNPSDPADLVKQPLPIPQHVSNLAVGHLKPVPEPEIGILPALLAVAMALGYLWRYLKERVAQPRIRLNRAQWSFVLSASAILVLIKVFYSAVPVEGLRVLLQPLAFLVGRTMDVVLHWEPGIGYVTQDGAIGIVKACAGLNFAIMVLALCVPLLLPRVGTLPQALVCLLASALAAYTGSLIANTVRICLAIYSYHHSWSWHWIDAAELHRIEGVTVYFLFLWGLYTLARKRLGFSASTVEKAKGVQHVQ